MHVGDVDIHMAVIIEVKDLDPHGAPGRFGKKVSALSDKAFSLNVFVLLVVPLHIQDIKIGPTVIICVKRGCITRPTDIHQTCLFRNIGESILSEVFIEYATFITVWFQMPGKTIFKTDIRVIDSVIFPHFDNFVTCILSDIDEKKVEQAVTVVIKKDRPEECP